MKANYKFVNNKVIEQTTGYIIFSSRKQKDLIAVTNYLNAGGAFNGRTPFFFLDKIENRNVYK